MRTHARAYTTKHTQSAISSLPGAFESGLRRPKLRPTARLWVGVCVCACLNVCVCVQLCKHCGGAGSCQAHIIIFFCPFFAAMTSKKVDNIAPAKTIEDGKNETKKQEANWKRVSLREHLPHTWRERGTYYNTQRSTIKKKRKRLTRVENQNSRTP